MLSSNQLPTPNPIPLRTTNKSFATLTCPSRLPSTALAVYLATKTLYQKLSLSTYILQHHLPNKARINSHVLLTPKPLTSIPKKIEAQLDMATGRIGDGFKHPRPCPRFHAPTPAPPQTLYFL